MLSTDPSMVSSSPFLPLILLFIFLPTFQPFLYTMFWATPAERDQGGEGGLGRRRLLRGEWKDQARDLPNAPELPLRKKLWKFKSNNLVESFNSLLERRRVPLTLEDQIARAIADYYNLSTCCLILVIILRDLHSSHLNRIIPNNS